MRTKYFLDWVPSPQSEVSADEARSSPGYHATAHYGQNGELERLELFEGTRLVRVDYWGTQDDDRRRELHLQQYGQVPLAVSQIVSKVGAYAWENVCMRSFSPSGDEVTVVLRLVSPGKDEVMEILFDEAGAVSMVTKYYYDDLGAMKYQVEYRKDGSQFAAYATQDEERLPLGDIIDAVPDSQFFAHGFNLPRELDGTSIPWEAARRAPAR